MYYHDSPAKEANLPADFNLRTLMFLDAADRQVSAASRMQAIFLSVTRPFQGELKLVSSESQIGDIQPRDSNILVVDALVPALLPLFPHIAGVVTERGSELSHAAIVAREMGLPVVRVKNAKAVFTDGARIEVAADGRVTLRE